VGLRSLNVISEGRFRSSFSANCKSNRNVSRYDAIVSGKIGRLFHARTSHRFSRRSPAASISSGVLLKYQ
jgi:hypothetical protein